VNIKAIEQRPGNPILITPVSIFPRFRPHDRLLGHAAPGQPGRQTVESAASQTLSLTLFRHRHTAGADFGVGRLALFKRDPALTATGAQLLRKALRFNIWFNRLLCDHLNLLLQEPGSDVLAPIRDVLVSNSIRK
jgi:hypothetical protein